MSEVKFLKSGGLGRITLDSGETVKSLEIKDGNEKLFVGDTVKLFDYHGKERGEFTITKALPVVFPQGRQARRLSHEPGGGSHQGGRRRGGGCELSNGETVMFRNLLGKVA